ncbi:MAG: cold shock domain-containing protein [Chromatiaceae bacterium]|jgi:cold shock CspA family protein|nr:cold shock domain-containing protein [Chromatiaceae bacterium]
MRTHGTLIKWHDDRGFGFIAPAAGSDELFVHSSALPRDSRRPHVGELISFEVEEGRNGQKRAVRIVRPGSTTPAHRGRRGESSTAKRRLRSAVLSLLAVGVIGAYGYTTLTARHAIATAEYATETAATAPIQRFQCDGRTRCSQMTSCAEARYFLQHCPNTQMDGNHDGEPCEQQWCY